MHIDFLRAINSLENIPPNAILVTFDASALYTNITSVDGLKAVKDALETRDNPEVPTEFIVKILDLVMKWNVFEFDQQMFIQLLGVAMGSKMSPNLADIFMAVIDSLIFKAASAFVDGIFPIMFFKRFLDDLFFIFTGSAANLHLFLDAINKLHPGIKFTMTHTKSPTDTGCDCEVNDSIPFLDTSLRRVDGKISSDL